LTPEETETAVCPHCFRPFEPGADYCTHCGGGLGTAETQIPYIPVPNSARFSEKHDASPAGLRPHWVRAVGVFFCVWMFTGFALVLVMATFGRRDGALDDASLYAYLATPVISLVAAVYSYRRSRRRASSVPPSSQR